MKIYASSLKDSIDFSELIDNFSAKYDSVHHIQIHGEDYIFRILGRKEFKRILQDSNLDEMDKEDAICETCVLWPEKFNVDNVEAGTPSILCKHILENSFLEDINSTLRLLEHFKNEMNELENQMVCIISEAFPNYTLDEIESWSNVRFCKMFSRAEWKFNNLRAQEIKSVTDLIRDVVEKQESEIDDEDEYYDDSMYTEDMEEDYEEVYMNKSEDKNISRNGKEKMTPEKLAELQRKFPEIDWTMDSTKDAIVNTYASSSPVATRPGTWGMGG